jgi:large subunit ribosomal protein L3
MAKFILAEKKEMTQKFTEDGTVIPVTKVVAGPCVVTQVKTDKKDGYTAVQIGFGSKRNLNKPISGHLKNLGNFRFLKEFRIADPEVKKLTLGDKITAKIFQAGDLVKVTGTSKGRGFQGVVKRHGFHGSPATHGHKDQLRHSGSIGAGGVQHVFKGMRMGGRMGGGQVTVTNLEIVEVDPEKNEIFIRGAVPGPISNLLLISGTGDLILEVEEKKSETDGEKTEEKEVKAEIKNEVAQEATDKNTK